LRFIVAASLIVAACYTPCQAADDSEYVLGVFDQITLRVARHDEYAGHWIIPEMGWINFPLVGEMYVIGRTLREVQDELTLRVGKRLRNPEVYVTLSAPRPQRMNVIGGVRDAGIFDIRPGWRVSEAIAAAGGLSMSTERSVCRLFRPGEPDRELDLVAILRDGDVEQNVLVREGDTIAVMAKKTMRVFVAGMVASPGAYNIEEANTALEAVTQAGGTTGAASLTRAYIYRKGEVIPVNLHSALVEGNAEADVALQEDDILTIPPQKTRVAVFGEVPTPGWFDMPEERDIYLSDALARAGGVKKSGVTSNVAILRREGDRIVKTEVDFRRYLKFGEAERNPRIFDSDVIVVSANRRGDYERIITGVLTLGLINLVGR
jgi:protein involved in polysaccharide export with SLBB domain